MDVCSSGRIGGGLDHQDYFALKFNGGILTSEAAPKEDYRAWASGQWWQNLRLPYYAMLAEGGFDLFIPLLRWYGARCQQKCTPENAIGSHACSLEALAGV
jgi:hypothetical protein